MTCRETCELGVLVWNATSVIWHESNKNDKSPSEVAMDSSRLTRRFQPMVDSAMRKNQCVDARLGAITDQSMPWQALLDKNGWQNTSSSDAAADNAEVDAVCTDCWCSHASHLTHVAPCASTCARSRRWLVKSSSEGPSDTRASA